MSFSDRSGACETEDPWSRRLAAPCPPRRSVSLRPSRASPNPTPASPCHVQIRRARVADCAQPPVSRLMRCFALDPSKPVANRGGFRSFPACRQLTASCDYFQQVQCLAPALRVARSVDCSSRGIVRARISRVRESSPWPRRRLDGCHGHQMPRDWMANAILRANSGGTAFPTWRYCSVRGPQNR